MTVISTPTQSLGEFLQLPPNKAKPRIHQRRDCTKANAKRKTQPLTVKAVKSATSDRAKYNSRYNFWLALDVR
jgi:hypothetical protein